MLQICSKWCIIFCIRNRNAAKDSAKAYAAMFYMTQLEQKLFIYNYILSTWCSASCSSQCLPWFSSILWFASLLSYKFRSLCFVPLPPNEKNNGLTSSAFLYKLSPINSGFHLRSAPRKAYPLGISRSPLDWRHILLRPCELQSNLRTVKILENFKLLYLLELVKHKYHDWQNIISRILLINAEIYLKHCGGFGWDGYFSS